MQASQRAYPPIRPLVVRFGRVGDMVLQTPLLHLLHRRFGLPCNLLTSGAWSVALFAQNDDVGDLWNLHRRHQPIIFSPQRWQLIHRLSRHTGPIYVSEDSELQLRKVRRLFSLAGVPSDHCTYLARDNSGRNHWIDRLTQLGKSTPKAFDPLAYPVDAGMLWSEPRLELSPADRVDRDTWLRQRGFLGWPLVLLQPANKRSIKWGRVRLDGDSKAWPVERWAKLAQLILSTLPNARVVLCGSVGESGYLRTIQSAARNKQVEVATSDLPIRRLMALTEIAHSMVSVDTGPAHIAAALGCPLVVLYGSESPLAWGRRGPKHSNIVELVGSSANVRCAEAISLHAAFEGWRALETGRSHLQDVAKCQDGIASTAENRQHEHI